MKLTEIHIALIQKYLSEELTGKDLETFIELKDIPEFKEELLNQARFIDSLEAADEELIRAELKKNDAQNEMKVNHTEKKRKPLRKFVLAITVAALFGVFLWFINDGIIGDSESKTNMELIAMHNVPYPVQEINRGGDDTIKVSQVMREYALGNYSQALNLFENISDPSEKVSLIKANCYLEERKFDNAISLLNSLMSSEDSEIRQNAQWYLAISHLGKDDINTSMNLLSTIADNPEHLFAAKAKKLMSALQ